MASKEPLSKSELLSRYSDPAWRNRYLELLHLTDFFAGCILSKNYNIPDAMNAAIKLSDSGKEVVRIATTKYGLKPKEARVRAFITLRRRTLLLDIDSTQVDALRQSLQAQIVSKRIIFPNAYGRELYDRAADLFEKRQTQLDFDETLKLLDGTSTGFYQLGRWTVGPLGVVPSAEDRWSTPSRSLPMFHCSKLTCHTVHRCRLTSDPKAAVNEAAERFSQALVDMEPEPAEWDQYESELLTARNSRLSDTSTGALHWLLGDAFSDAELRELATLLLDSVTSGRLRDAANSIKGLRGPAERLLEGLDRWEVLHLILLCKDAEIIRAIEIWLVPEPQGSPPVPSGEVRRAVTNSRYGYGQFGLRAELNEYGVRFTSEMPGMPHLRLHRLIGKIYDKSVHEDISEFDWQFREADAVGRDQKQEQLLRSMDPGDVVRRIVLGRRTSMLTTCTILGIDPDSFDDDERFTRRVLWKLGYEEQPRQDINAQFWKLHDSMMAVAQTAIASATIDESEIRRLASDYFVELEHVLDDALIFTTWATTNDHLSGPSPFRFEPEGAREASLEVLAAHMSKQASAESHDFLGPLSLYSLMRGFAILGDLLSNLTPGRPSELREFDQLPLDMRGSDLRDFPFNHRCLYLDLTGEARSDLVIKLREISRRLIAADVNDVRNSWLHYRRSTTSVDPLLKCLEAVRSGVTLMESMGISRIMFWPSQRHVDFAGRTLVEFSDPRGRSISITGPSRSDLSELPSLEEPQYLLTSLVLNGWGDFARASGTASSEYSRIWSDYPKRRIETKENLSTADQPAPTDLLQ